LSQKYSQRFHICRPVFLNYFCPFTLSGCLATYSLFCPSALTPTPQLYIFVLLQVRYLFPLHRNIKDDCGHPYLWKSYLFMCISWHKFLLIHFCMCVWYGPDCDGQWLVFEHVSPSVLPHYQEPSHMGI
jgi:hypothetical protein